jgi:hypothetical protein
VTRATLQRLATKLMEKRLDLPAVQVGEFAITQTQHKPGDKLLLASMRDSIFMGWPACDYICREPTIIHRLTEDGGVWMSDLPCELVQMHQELAKHATGNVIIGGLGLGVLANMVARNPKVKRVVVIERQPEVIQMIQPHLSSNVEVVRADIMDMASWIYSDKFDVALLDTWQGTGEWVWQTEVVPLRRMLVSKIKNIRCWHEQVMLSQVAMGLFRAAAVPSSLYKQASNCHMYAFVRHLETSAIQREIANPDNFPALLKAEEENRKNRDLRALAYLFLERVGTPTWEEWFGKHWDTAFQKEVVA